MERVPIKGYICKADSSFNELFPTATYIAIFVIICSTMHSMLLMLACNRNIYWTDSRMKSIYVCKEDGNYKATVISGGNDFTPTSIAVNPALRLVTCAGLHLKMRQRVT